jgi:hypothetical protein
MIAESTRSKKYRRVPWVLILQVYLLMLGGVSSSESNPIYSDNKQSTNSSMLVLHWKNGDALSGRLLPAQGSWVRWDSPIFLDPLRVNSRSLHSIRFPSNIATLDHQFRISTVSGDVFVADLVSSDAKAFHVKSQRHGDFRVRRDAVYSLNRINHPRELFDGSQFDQWGVALGGPIRNLNYQTYALKHAEMVDFPDFNELKPVQKGYLASSYFDLGITQLKRNFGMIFDGALEVNESGDYQFHVSASGEMRFWVDGELLAKAKEGNIVAASRKLTTGPHQLKVEFVNEDSLGELRVWWSGPGFKNRSLVGTNRQMGWHRDMGGQATTALKRTGLFKSIEIPEKFMMELEVTSSSQPQFVIGLGSTEDIAEKEDAFKIETWGSEVVVAQGKRVEAVQTLGEGKQDVRIRMIYDKNTDELNVFDMNGALLRSVKGMKPQVGNTGIFLRNRGDDLYVRRLSLFRHAIPAGGSQTFETSKPSVQILDGTIYTGKLHLDQESARVIDSDGLEKEINIETLDRITSPTTKLSPTQTDVTLTYFGGEVVHGQLDSFTENQVNINTAFTSEPLICQLDGAVRLEFNGSPSMSDPLTQFRDHLFTTAGKFRGKLTFGLEGAPFGWKPDGAEKPLRMKVTEPVRIERDPISADVQIPYELVEYPSMLYLQNGEILPCEILSFSSESFNLQSPFLKRKSLDSSFMKAIEFKSENRSIVPRDSKNEPYNLLNKVFKSVSSQIDLPKAEKLFRVLNVSNFRQEKLPEHFLITVNGDLIRGTLTSIAATKATVESKSRNLRVSRRLLSGIVNVASKKLQLNHSVGIESLHHEQVCIWMVDGSILVIRAMDSKNGIVSGRSNLYGEISIPVQGIQNLLLSPANLDVIPMKYEDWVIEQPH